MSNLKDTQSVVTSIDQNTRLIIDKGSDNLPIIDTRTGFEVCVDPEKSPNPLQHQNLGEDGYKVYPSSVIDNFGCPLDFNANQKYDNRFQVVNLVQDDLINANEISEYTLQSQNGV